MTSQPEHALPGPESATKAVAGPGKPNAKPPRRDVRKTHLDAGLVPLEQSLLQRADELEQRQSHDHLAWLDRLLAAELRAIAEEIHWH